MGGRDRVSLRPGAAPGRAARRRRRRPPPRGARGAVPRRAPRCARPPALGAARGRACEGPPTVPLAGGRSTALGRTTWAWMRP